MKAELLKHSLRDNRAVLEYQIQDGEMMDGLVLKQCKEGKIPGVLLMGAAYENGHNYMYAYIDKKETLAEQLKDVVTEELILNSFENIVSTLVRMEEQEINLAYAVMNVECIYMDAEAKKARIICMPGKKATMEEDELPNFFRNILANAVYLNSDDGNYVAKLLTAVNSEFELKSFLRLIHGLMRDAGIEIVEEKIEEPVVAEPVAPAAPVVEPVVAEPVTPAAPVVEPVVAEPATPVMGVIPEDDIEFEPMPEEMNAKIERMNEATSAVQPTPVEPQPVQPTAPVPPVQPVEPQPVQPTAPVPPIQPVQPTAPVNPQPRITPQDAGLQQTKVPNPHLVRVKTGENIPLTDEEFVIGKSVNGVNYTVADNSAVSRVHCTIIKRNGAYYVRDERSTNCTYVNGEQVTPGTEKLLLNNCKIFLGDEEFIYSLW
ncbi:MAG: FHA domain-containing protein [Lachnospiraceae bacterium]|nr:FHA domain-containing protein [Lachnospiraceae bacterium]